jgi:hypothetical protein
MLPGWKQLVAELNIAKPERSAYTIAKIKVSTPVNVVGKANG